MTPISVTTQSAGLLKRGIVVTTPAQRRFFEEDGYIVIPEMFSRHEVEVVMNDLKCLDTEHLVVDASWQEQGEYGGRRRGDASIAVWPT